MAKFTGVLFLLVFFNASAAFGALKLISAEKEVVQQVQSQGLEFVSDHFSHPIFMVGYIEEADYNRLSKDWRSKITVMNEQRWAMGGYDKLTLTPIPFHDARKDKGYHDYVQLTQLLKDIQATHPHLVRLATAGKSVQGRELWYVVVTQNPNAVSYKPKFIFHANMHGDEVVGRELMIFLLQHFTQTYNKEARVTQLLNNAEIFIMPSMNPDGYEAGTRANARGKDLNRNFPDRFTSPSDTPEGREIEVQHMMKLAKQNHFIYGINWHGGEICFNLPWGNISNSNPNNKFGDDPIFYPIGREYTQWNEPMYANHHDNFDHGLTYGYEWYPVNGGINDWYNYFRRSVHSVIELSTTKWPNASTLSKFWDDNREAMITYLLHGLKGVHLEIKGPNGVIVAQPTIAIGSSPKRPLTFDDGYVHRMTGAGLQKVTITATGFQPKTIETQAKDFDGTFISVELATQ